MKFNLFSRRRRGGYIRPNPEADALLDIANAEITRKMRIWAIRRASQIIQDILEEIIPQTTVERAAFAAENYELISRGFNLRRELIHRKLFELTGSVKGPILETLNVHPEPIGEAEFRARYAHGGVYLCSRVEEARLRIECLRRPL